MLFIPTTLLNFVWCMTYTGTQATYGLMYYLPRKAMSEGTRLFKKKWVYIILEGILWFWI